MQNILRIPEVVKATGLPRSTLYWKIQRGEFPAPIKLGQRASGWLETEVLAWQRSRIEQRENA